MGNFNVFICFLIILLYIEKSSSQFVQVKCYECTNCTDPFSANSSSVTITSSCNTCYKLSVIVAYAPSNYVIRKCVPACIESSQMFGGGSVTGTCCATDLCNTSSMKIFSLQSRVLLFLFIILTFLKRSYF